MEKSKKESVFFTLSNWQPKTVSFKLKETVLWPFKNDRQKITIFLLIGLIAITAGFFNFLLDQRKVKAQTEISSWEDLHNIRNNLSGNYILTTNLSSSTLGYDDYAGPLANGGEGWLPIGNNINPFKGIFDGEGYKINDLFINRPITDYIGLFGYIDTGSSITDIGLENIDINGQNYTGGIVGYNNNGEITKSYVLGSVEGVDYVGGFVGAIYSATANIENSFSIVNVNGNSFVGGFAGYNEGVIDSSYSAGAVIGAISTGGFVGTDNCPPGYPPCDNISNSFYDEDISGQSDINKGEPKTTFEMKEVRTFTDVAWSAGLDFPWDFVGNPYDDLSNNDIWDIDEEINNGYSFLTSFVISAPSLTTNSPSTTTINSSFLRGEIIDTGGENATVRGFKYYESNNCSGDENYLNEAGSFGIGEYSLQLTGLSSNTTYSYKAYAENSSGEGEGLCVSFNTLSSSSPPPASYYNLSLNVYPELSGEVFGMGSYAEGSSITINTAPKNGYSFLYWKEGENIVSTEKSHSLIVNSNRSLIAYYEKDKYLIKNLTEGLSVFNTETEEDLTVSPQIGEVFAFVKKGEVIVAKLKINFDKNLDYSSLKADTEYFSLNNKDYGRSFLHFKDKDEMGILDVFLFIPATREKGTIYICPLVDNIEDIKEDCKDIYYLEKESINGYYEVKINHTGGAEKPEIVKYNVVLSVNLEEGGTVEGFGEYLENDNVTIKAISKDGYQFLNWTENGVIISEESAFHFIVENNRNIRANFEAIDEIIFGCTDSEALNYDSLANTDDGSCEYEDTEFVDPAPIVYGCTDNNALNYNPLANIDDNSCKYETDGTSTDLIYGCTDNNALNYNPLANIDDNSCQYEKITRGIGEFFAGTIKEAFKTTKEFIDSPVGKTTTGIITTTGVAVGMTNLVATAIFINPFSFSNIFFTLLRFWSLLLVFLGIKKRHKPWGTVYDSITKQPLDPAYVFLQDDKEEVVSDSITDLDGRYGFLAKPGIYKIMANKTNYTFPSEKLKGKNEDGVYDKLYFGDTIEIKEEEEVIDKNIPMDSLSFDWNEFAKKESKKMKFYSDMDKIFSGKMINIFFYFGFFIAVVAVVSAPYPYNIVVLVLYFLLILLRKLGFSSKKGGYITEKKTGRPLSFAIIRIFLPEGEKETIKKVASATGKYFCLVSPGEYYVKIEKKNDDGSYTHVYTSSLIKAKKGIIRENFKV